MLNVCLKPRRHLRLECRAPSMGHAKLNRDERLSYSISFTIHIQYYLCFFPLLSQLQEIIVCLLVYCVQFSPPVDFETTYLCRNCFSLLFKLCHDWYIPCLFSKSASHFKLLVQNPHSLCVCHSLLLFLNRADVVVTTGNRERNILPNLDVIDFKKKRPNLT